jgi:hypothetical protein
MCISGEVGPAKAGWPKNLKNDYSWTSLSGGKDMPMNLQKITVTSH